MAYPCKVTSYWCGATCGVLGRDKIQMYAENYYDGNGNLIFYEIYEQGCGCTKPGGGSDPC